MALAALVTKTPNMAVMVRAKGPTSQMPNRVDLGVFAYRDQSEWRILAPVKLPHRMQMV